MPAEDAAKRQLQNAGRLPVVFGRIAAMPDVHLMRPIMAAPAFPDRPPLKRSASPSTATGRGRAGCCHR
jgi:hypothetical protein